MRARCLVLAAMLAVLLNVAGLALDLEVAVGTEPSVSLGVAWDFLANLSLVGSVGIAYESIQTGSFTIGAELRYRIALRWQTIRPYVGLGASLQIGGGNATLRLSSTAGVRVHLLRNLFLFADGSVCVSVPHVVDWDWRARLGCGFVLPF